MDPFRKRLQDRINKHQAQIEHHVQEIMRLQTMLDSKIETDDVDQCNKRKCGLCRKLRFCLQCHERLFCGKNTKCWACGRGGRRLDHMTGTGVLILTMIKNKPCVVMVKEPPGSRRAGQIGDIGGRFDPDQESNLDQTLCREVFEEIGFKLDLSKTEMINNWVDLNDEENLPTYRTYFVMVNNLRMQPAECQPVYIPIENWKLEKTMIDIDGVEHTLANRVWSSLRLKIDGNTFFEEIKGTLMVVNLAKQMQKLDIK